MFSIVTYPGVYESLPVINKPVGQPIRQIIPNDLLLGLWCAHNATNVKNTRNELKMTLQIISKHTGFLFSHSLVHSLIFTLVPSVKRT
jgi:hypothetical protein